MPFKSKKQETYLKINEPKIYKEWKEKYGTFKSDILDNKNEQSKYMAQDKTGYEIPTDDNGSFFMQIRGDKETIQKAFKDWKPKAYPYEKRITQDSLNITCENCGKENVHYQFYLPQKNSRNTRMRFVDGATYCKYDEGNCGANLCSDCADDNDCENCGAEMCSSCADESEYNDNHKICVPCREADEEMNAETWQEKKGYTDDEVIQAQYPNHFLLQKYGDYDIDPHIYRNLFIGLSALDDETLNMLEEVIYYDREENMGDKMHLTLANVREYRKLYHNVYNRYPPAYNSKTYYGAETFEANPNYYRKSQVGIPSPMSKPRKVKADDKLHAWATTMLSDVKLLIEDLENGAVYDLDDCRERLEKIRDDTSHLDAETIDTGDDRVLHEKGDYRIVAEEDYDALWSYKNGMEEDDYQELNEQAHKHGMWKIQVQKKVWKMKSNWETIDSLSGVVPSATESLEDLALKEMEIPEGVVFEAPYAGLGSLFGFGQDTGLGSFTTSELTGSSAIHGDFDSASLNYSGHQAVFARAENEMKNVEFEDWAKQEMKTHGKDVSFKNWAKKEEKSHGNVELMDWAEHEEESHDERYGADMKTYEAYDDKISERQEYLIGKLGGKSNSDMTRSQASDLIKKLQGKRSGTWRAEEPMVEEPDFIPDGDGRALGQQTSSINLSPLHAESRFDKLSKQIADEYEEKGESPEEAERIGDATAAKIGRMKYGKKGMENLAKKETEYITKTNMLIAGVVGIGLWKGKEILDMTMASLKRSAEEKRKGKACGSCNSQGSIRKTHTQVKNSEYSVDQVNPVEVQGQNDIHGAEGVTNPRHSPSSEPFGYPSKSLKMW